MCATPFVGLEKSVSGPLCTLVCADASLRAWAAPIDCQSGSPASTVRLTMNWRSDPSGFMGRGAGGPPPVHERFVDKKDLAAVGRPDGAIRAVICGIPREIDRCST